MWTQSSYPDMDPSFRLLPNFTADFLVQGYICDKIFMNIQSLLPENEPNCGKMPYLAMLKNPSKNSWIRIQKQMTPKI